MNNQEAIIVGVQKWLENNSEFVGKAVTRGVENAMPEIAAAVGLNMSARLAKFMSENREEFIKVGKEMTTKAVMDQLMEEVAARNINLRIPDLEPEAEKEKKPGD